MQPVVQVRLSQLLMSRYRWSAEKAVEEARELTTALRRVGMDIVVGDWMAGEVEANPKFDWNNIARFITEAEADGRTPWNSPELK